MGLTGGMPANFGGISINALLISTATGLRSEAWASRPRRWASSGIEPPPAKGVVDRRWIAVGGLQNLGARLAQHLLVIRILPLDKPLDNAEQPLALLLLGILGRELLGMAARVVHKRGEQHRTASGQA